MRRAILALGLSLALGTPSFGQLDSPLRLVRALRSAGLVDLAIECLQELKSKPGLLTADEIKQVPLELARIHLEQASRETDIARRTSLVSKARLSFEEFIRNNPTDPMAAQANVEIARLYALQAKGQLSRANRIEDETARAMEFARARPDFNAAINRYQGAITNLDNRLKTVKPNSSLAIELTNSRAQAELDAAILRYELAGTYVGDEGRRQKGEQIAKAEKAFNVVAKKYGNARSATWRPSGRGSARSPTAMQPKRCRRCRSSSAPTARIARPPRPSASQAFSASSTFTPRKMPVTRAPPPATSAPSAPPSAGCNSIPMQRTRPKA